MSRSLLIVGLILSSALVAPTLIAATPATRAMWVFKTEAIMASASEQNALFAFCGERGITDLFWQCHYEKTDGGGRSLKDAAVNRAFLRSAHAKAIRIHALGGDPSHALTKNHEHVMAMVDALLAFNRAGKPDERFDGMHPDIEPHALPQWKTADNSAKCDLLTQFVTVNALAAERLRGGDASLAYGADIVFWLDKMKPDGAPVYPVTFRGKTKDAAKHLLDVVDNVGIMSYRNASEGRNGMIQLVANTIAYADTARGRAFVGVKMADIGPKMETFFGQTETEMMKALRPVDETYGSHRGYAGLAFFMYEAFKIMPRGQ